VIYVIEYLVVVVAMLLFLFIGYRYKYTEAVKTASHYWSKWQHCLSQLESEKYSRGSWEKSCHAADERANNAEARAEKYLARLRKFGLDLPEDE
jgi:hypothetical protein